MSKIDWKALGEAAAEAGEDHSKVKEGGGGIPLAPEGDTVMRLVEYVELGEHVKMHNGKPKAPAPMVRLTFDLLSAKHIREVEIDGQKVKIANRITLPEMPLYLSEKGNFRKLFDRMTGKDEKIKNMVQLLGEPFLGTVVHNTVGDKVYANLRDDNGYTIRPAYIDEVDENGLRTGKRKKLAVPPALSELRGFLWKNATREQWDTLFIDGEYESKDENGKDVVKSKNFIQNRIKQAVNFVDSPIFNILGGIDSVETHLEDVEAEVALEEEEDEIVLPGDKPAKEAKAPAKGKGKKANTVAPDDAELAEMGFID